MAVVELLGLERRRLLLDQRLGEVEQLLVGLLVTDVTEIALRLVDLVGIAQRLQHDAASAGFEADDIFAAAQGELAKADLLGPAQRLAGPEYRFRGAVVGEIGRAPVRERVGRYG